MQRKKYTESLVEIHHRKGPYTITCKEFSNFSDLWGTYTDPEAAWIGIDAQGVTRVQAQSRLSTTGIWGFVTPEDRTVYFCAAAVGVDGDGGTLPHIIAFFAHEVDHLLRGAETLEESEASAVITADCARVATYLATNAGLLGEKRDRQ